MDNSQRVIRYHWLKYKNNKLKDKATRKNKVVKGKGRNHGAG
jgi:hypothetical protein